MGGGRSHLTARYDKEEMDGGRVDVDERNRSCTVASTTDCSSSGMYEGGRE